MPEKLLIVDDESNVRESTMRLLQRRGYDVEGAGSGAEALAKLAANNYDLMLADIKMPGMSGLELLRQAKEHNPHLMALFMTGYGTVENAIEALKLGALGFIRKPMPIDELTKAIEDALAKERLRRENERLRALMPLFEVSKVFLSETDENKVLALILFRVVSETKANTVEIMLREENGKLVQKIAYGIPKTNETGIVSDAVADRVMSSLEPAVCQRDNITISTPEGTQSQSGCDIYVPLVVRGEAIGILKATKLGDKASYRQGDTEFLFTLCGQGAAAIANARLFESVQRKQAEVEELLKRVLDTTESERLRLSLELHDGPVQSIVAAQYGVESCRILVNKNELGKAEAKMEGIQKMLAQSIHDLRRIVRDLHPPVLGNSGLVSAVEEYLSNLEKDDGIACHLELNGTMVNLGPSTERSVYYVIREALTNIRKHSGASEVSVIINFNGSNLTAEIIDNGKGFDLADKNDHPSDGHIGLKGMRERAKMLNGDVVIESNPNNGTKIKLSIPIKNTGSKDTALPDSK